MVREGIRTFAGVSGLVGWVTEGERWVFQDPTFESHQAVPQDASVCVHASRMFFCYWAPIVRDMNIFCQVCGVISLRGGGNDVIDLVNNVNVLSGPETSGSPSGTQQNGHS